MHWFLSEVPQLEDYIIRKHKKMRTWHNVENYELYTDQIQRYRGKEGAEWGSRKNKLEVTYLSTVFSSGNLFSKKLLSDESECKSLDGSATGKLQIKDDKNGSGAAAGGLDTKDDPPRNDCKLPFLKSFLNKDNKEWDPVDTFWTLRLRCMYYSLRKTMWIFCSNIPMYLQL